MVFTAGGGVIHALHVIVKITDQVPSGAGGGAGNTYIFEPVFDEVPGGLPEIS